MKRVFRLSENELVDAVWEFVVKREKLDDGGYKRELDIAVDKWANRLEKIELTVEKVK